MVIVVVQLQHLRQIINHLLIERVARVIYLNIVVFPLFTPQRDLPAQPRFGLVLIAYWIDPGNA